MRDVIEPDIPRKTCAWCGAATAIGTLCVDCRRVQTDRTYDTWTHVVLGFLCGVLCGALLAVL